MYKIGKIQRPWGNTFKFRRLANNGRSILEGCDFSEWIVYSLLITLTSYLIALRDSLVYYHDMSTLLTNNQFLSEVCKECCV